MRGGWELRGELSGDEGRGGGEGVVDDLGQVKRKERERREKRWRWRLSMPDQR